MSAVILFPTVNSFNANQNVNAVTDISDDSTVTITFLDFEGNAFQTLEIEKGSSIDYSLINTDHFNKHIDKYTEIQFNSWNISPETAEEDISIQALYKLAHIELVSMPTQTEFYDKTGSINLNGLKVNITIVTQTDKFDTDGKRILLEEIIDVAESCYTEPADLSEAFADGDAAIVSIYPITSDIPLAQYDITYYKDFGDINYDGMITAIDAALVLSEYAAVNTGNVSVLSDEQRYRSDIDKNNMITPTDAANILNYYAKSATTDEPVYWQDYIN